jgi:hypothetical protein
MMEASRSTESRVLQFARFGSEFIISAARYFDFLTQNGWTYPSSNSILFPDHRIRHDLLCNQFAPRSHLTPYAQD